MIHGLGILIMLPTLIRRSQITLFLFRSRERLRNLLSSIPSLKEFRLSRGYAYTRRQEALQRSFWKKIAWECGPATRRTLFRFSRNPGVRFDASPRSMFSGE